MVKKMSNKKIVLYVGNFSFPFGNASGKRVYGNGKLLRNLGYKVIFVGMDNEVSSLDLLKNTRKEYDGFTYYNFSYPKNNLEWINYKRTFNELISFLNDENIINDLGLVIYYGSLRLSIFNTKLINYCKKNNIKIVSDCVDWLTVKTNNFLFDLIKWADNTYQKAYANKKTDGVITISSYLANYYERYGRKTVIIPPLSSTNKLLSTQNFNDTDNKIITYAGLPFRKNQMVTDCTRLKDRIDKTIILLYEAKQAGCKFVFSIYGFTKEEYLKVLPEQQVYVNELAENLIFHGFKSNEEILNNISNSHFTILIRDVNRDTTAGFPTKVSESISCGTPVITTRTSDLEEYILDGKSGFFLDAEDNNQASSRLKNILGMSKEDIESMKLYCINNKVFSYKNFTNRAKNFFNEIDIH